ncbi:glycerate kinase [Facklamia miroungae]|uniref:Glycerate kinase n=1 Tax=Facklamia miroungae TaxID=120956 RepID=A0A1G7SUY6_9LACT|nr:glycerate kinase [Facklamia miroungae]NKZ29545.1 glycerate kinase [Facklamia miroungae]SDG26259.1 glycerate kinase [Facklamia miroungae]
MKIVIACDSFKEAISAKQACYAIKKGIEQVFPDAEIVQVPMADGGEGTTEALIDASQGSYHRIQVQGPLGDEVQARYDLLGDGQTAVIEMASASGIHLVKKENRNPLLASTYGTGQVIKTCLDQGIRSFILGIGGSATNDGGAGMAQALGYRLLDKKGKEIALGNQGLAHLDRIDSYSAHPALAEARFKVACDVNNPLYGPQGASAVFGPQKGATSEMIAHLDANLEHFSRIIYRDLGREVAHVAGAGAAGGLGAGLLAFTQAELQRGIDIVIETVHLKEALEGVDICFTGEGQIDHQTQYGKTPFGVMRLAKKVAPQSKVIALCGSVGKEIENLYQLGFDGIFSITPGPSSLEDLLPDTQENLTASSRAISQMLLK